MSVYSEFFLKARANIVQIECMEISHPAFSQTFYLVRNAARGVTVTHEDASSHAYQYVPMRLSLTGPRDDLEHILHVDLGDLGEIIPEQIDAIRADNSMGTKPKVFYRTYQSTDLTTPLYGPIELEIKNITLAREGSSFDAKAPSLNISKTGELYSLPRFPMLRGLR